MTSAHPQVVLVTGAASGIGRCFVQHFLGIGNTIVIAADINPIKIGTGQPQTPNNSNYNTTKTGLITVVVDFASAESIQALVKRITSSGTQSLNLVIHSAGIRGLVPSIENENPREVPVAETFDVMDPETMLRTFQVNTLGTFTLLQSLQLQGLLSSPASILPTKIVIMTSRMGSISYNTAGGAYAYRASKAALNAVVRSMRFDVPGVVFALVHPGRVETGLTKFREEGAIEVEESVGDMLKLTERLTLEDSGRFIDRFGVDIGW